jgi:hypothetical protein
MVSFPHACRRTLRRSDQRIAMTMFPPKKPFDLASTHPRPALHAAPSDPWANAPRLPGERPEGFVPMEVLLHEMGLASPRRTSADGVAVPLVAPHPTDVAEFSPPRPLRRPATGFAHLSLAKTGES